MPKGTTKKQTTTKGGAKKNEVKKVSDQKGLPKFVFRHLKPSRKLGQGGVLPKSSALGRLMRWPKYVKLQRQRKILLQRLKIPPSINIFTQYAPKALAKSLIRLFAKYRPETRKQKRDRLRSIAKLQAGNKPIPSEKKFLVKCGFNHVTNLIENGKAKLVLIAHDVDPIEIVMWMPVLCVKKNIPFCIFRSKARLGTLVNKKTAAVVCLTGVDANDQETLQQLADQVKQKYNDQLDKLRRKWGARTLGIKTRHRIEKRKRIRKEEAAKRKSAQNKDESEQKKIKNIIITINT